MATNDYKELLNRLYGKRSWDEMAYVLDREIANARELSRDAVERRSRMNCDIRYCIKDVIFNDPATIVFWTDGTKTVVKCENEDYDPEKGLAMCICKRVLGNKGNYYNVFRKWLPKEPELNESLNARLKDICKPATFAFELKSIESDLFKKLTGSGNKFVLGFDLAAQMEEKKDE